MSAPKWTSGPWCVGVPMDGETYSPDKVFDVFGESVAMVYGMAINTPLSEQPERSLASIANAHLIAAAPDLYAALERQSALVEALAKCRKAGGVHIYDVDGEALFVNLLRTLELARAALAKARGEG